MPELFENLRDPVVTSMTFSSEDQWVRIRAQDLAYRGMVISSTENLYAAFFKQIQLASGNFLTDREKIVLSECFKSRKLRRRQYFLQEGDVCKYVGFLCKGAAKMYAINERGQESIIAFWLENDWITNIESFLGESESAYHIEALEDMEMLVVERGKFFVLLREIGAFDQLFKQYQIRQLIQSHRRIHASLSMTAEERYLQLLATHPCYAQRFSQNMLASYLGVKPETLSRIRNRFLSAG